jgi:phage terminase large subunit
VFPFSQLLYENFTSTAKIIANQGGTWSGKTYNILETLILKAIETLNTVITVAGQDIPNLKKGAIRDIKNIVSLNPDVNNYLKGGSWSNAYNISDRILTFKNGSLIEFNSYDSEQDARSGKRDYLFINEANGIDYQIFWQLFIRTEKQCYIDYNPSARFWVHDNILVRSDSQLIISDHRQNTFISDEMHREIESIEDEELFKVYARGLTGKVRGLVFHNWRLCERFPDCKKWVYGMDFGFSNSYTTLVRVGLYEGELYIEELLYERGLQNEDILSRLQSLDILKSDWIICDSNEPKTREWIASKGYYITKTHKGTDTNPAVNYGLSLMKSYRINITADSVNTKKEFERYSWKIKDGKELNEPVKMFDHSIDAARYGFVEILAENVAYGFY